MGEPTDATEHRSAVSVESAGDDGGMDSFKHHETLSDADVTLASLLRRLITDTFFPNPSSACASIPPLRRIKVTFSQNAPLLAEASRNTGRDVLQWTRRGGPFRALLVVSVGTIIFLALTGLLVFMLFFIAATVNAIMISLLVSLAVAASFLALFFAFVTAIYIGALSLAVFVISSVTVFAIMAVLITTGWIGFFLLLGLAANKSLGLAKRSLSVTGSAVSAYSARHSRRHHASGKVSD